MPDKTLGIQVTGDVSDIQDAINTLAETLGNLIDKMVNIGVTVEDTELENLEGELAGLENQTINETVTVDDTEVQEVDNELQALEGQTIDEKLAIDSSDINTVDSELEALEGKDIQEKITVDSSDIEDAAGKLDQIGSSGEAAANQVQNSMDGATKSIDEVGKSAEDAAKQTEQVGNKSEKAGEQAEGGFGQAVLALAGLTAGLELAVEKTDELNAKFSKMSNTVGSIPEENMRKLVADITNAHFPADEALNYITLLKQMGVTSEDSLRRGATAMNEMRVATGSSEETINKFANSIVVMGIDLNNLPEAFNAIAYAQANVVGGFSTYVQWMQKYDSTFKEMGLNIDQTAVLIAAATKKFGGGRAAYQGLNEAIKESNGDLSILEQRLGMQPGALSRASEETAKYSGKIDRNTQSVQEHTTAWQKFMAMLEDFQVVYGDWISFFGSIVSVITGVTAAVVGMGGSLSKALNSVFDTTKFDFLKVWQDTLRSKLETMGSRILETIKGWTGWGEAAAEKSQGITKALDGAVDETGFLGKLRNFGSRVVETIKGWTGWSTQTKDIDMVKGLDGSWEAKAPGFLEKIVGWGRSVPGKLSDAISSVGIKLPSLEGVGLKIPEGLSTGLLKGIPKLIGDVAIPLAVIQSAAEGLYHYTDMLSQNPVELLWNIYLGGTYQLLPQQLRDFIQSVTGWMTPEKLGKAVFGEDFYNGFVGWFTSNIVNPFRSAVDNFIPNLQKLLSGEGGVKVNLMGILFGDQDPNDISPVWSFFEGVKGAITGFMSWLTGVPMQLVPWDWANVFGNFNLIWQNIQTQFGNFVSWLSTLPQQVTGFISQIPTILTGALANFTTFLSNIPYTVGLAVGNALSVVLEGIYNLIVFVKGLPAQVSAEISNLGSSISGGVNGAVAGVKSSVGNITKIFTDFITYLGTLPEQLSKWGSQFIGNLQKGLEDGYKGVTTFLTKTVPDSFSNFIKWIQNLPKQLYDAGEEVIKNLEKGLTDAYNAVVKFFTKTVPDSFSNFIKWLESIPNQIYNLGVSIISNLEKGLTDAWNAVLSFFTQTIPNAFNDFLNWCTSLPQKFFDAAKNALDGFMKGLNASGAMDWLKKIYCAIAGCSPGIIPALNDMSSAGKDHFRALGNHARSTIGNINGMDVSGLTSKVASFRSSLSKGMNLAINSISPSSFEVPKRTMDIVNQDLRSNDNGSGSSGELHLHFEIGNINARNEAEADEAAETLAEKVIRIVKEELGVELGQKGLSIYKV
ncbi:MAG: Chromosome partition protein Smc [Candidatus Methanofastidiosum methylothiophilum]|uniref:Chromosome partition protein Smc n=1 Tax=Candidatus Methanofastidiosum methylothiophilum TaxID=1705564 RepID=A0A150J9F6_9EURY|nr:MAG: Chromosome partition protein Smc [Candidatus Methanofastidiosum methylthiophilus]